MPIWLIILIILIVISLISSLFSWIGEHIVPICLTIIAVVALIFLKVYVIPLFVVAFIVYLILGKSSTKKQVKKKEDNKDELNKQKVESLDIDKDTKETLLKGYEYIKLLKDYNDRIPDEMMSSEMTKLENTLRKIFDEIKKHPEKANKVRKMMDYYLPTIDGILSRYAEYDAEGITGGRIEDTKKNVAGTMETINKGFEGILNSLFSEDAMDINSDLVVMKQMLENDGLIDM